MNNTPSPADLYVSRRSTAASQATARSALNAAARCLGHSDLNDLDWALKFADASLIKVGINMLEPGWAKAVWSAVRQVTVIARSLRLIDADTSADVLAIPGPRGGGEALAVRRPMMSSLTCLTAPGLITRLAVNAIWPCSLDAG